MPKAQRCETASTSLHAAGMFDMADVIGLRGKQGRWSSARLCGLVPLDFGLKPKTGVSMIGSRQGSGMFGFTLPYAWRVVRHDTGGQGLLRLQEGGKGIVYGRDRGAEEDVKKLELRNPDLESAWLSWLLQSINSTGD